MTAFTKVRFNAWRNDDGQLNVNVNKVDLSNKYDAGNGVCFRNSSFSPANSGEFSFPR